MIYKVAVRTGTKRSRGLRTLLQQAAELQSCFV